MEDKTFEECAKDKAGTIYADGHYEGVRYIVMRGPAALCAYLGVPAAHPLAGKSYDDIPIDVHGGLTFASAAHDAWPEGYFWYGWDYAHSGDTSFHDLEPWAQDIRAKRDEHGWTPREVEEEARSCCYDMARLMRLAEGISTAASK